MNILIDILRKAEHDRIQTDPAMVKVTVYPTKLNAYDVPVPDWSKEPQSVELGPVLIVPAGRPEVQNANKPDVSTWNNDFMIIAEHDMSWVQRGLSFEHNARVYRILEPVYVRHFGDIIAIHAHLDDVTGNSTPADGSIVIGAGTVAPIVIGG